MVREVIDDTVIIGSLRRVIVLGLEGGDFVISEIDMREGGDKGDWSSSGKRLIVRRGDDHIFRCACITSWRRD